MTPICSRQTLSNTSQMSHPHKLDLHSRQINNNLNTDQVS